jgi:hypothetical protein
MKKFLAIVVALVGSLALADGFSVTGNLTLRPSFGLAGGLFITPYRSYRGTSLNYSFNLSENWLAGASVRPGFFDDIFQLTSRVGVVGVFKLNESNEGYVEAAVRLASNQSIVPSPFNLDLEAGAEIFINQRIADQAVLYGGAGVTGNRVVIPDSFFTAVLAAYTGLKFEFTPSLDAYLEGGIRYPIGSSIGYDVTTSLYYTIFKGARIGLYTGLMTQGATDPNFKIGLAGEWIQNPETLGTPGNYAP